MRKGILSTIVCVMMAVGLLACGGGGGGGGGTDGNTNSAPVANAGTGQNVSTGSVVTLDGSGSSDANGDTLTYTWSFTSKPASSTATLSSAPVVNPTFTADKDGAYVLSLVVNDGTMNSAPDSVTITASTGNSAPVANAGPDQNVSTGSVVALNGSGSSDADGDTLTYHWSLTNRPGTSSATLSNTTIVDPTFTADVDGTYIFSLFVNDGKVNSAADSVTITATTSNSAPVANAGPDQTVVRGALVTLSGSGSSDTNGDPLTYSWSFTSKPGGSTATLSSTSVVNPTFTADLDGSYVISLVVNDGQVNSTEDALTVTALKPVPVPDTGQTASYTATLGEDHDYLINPPSYTDNSDGTITDNVTGLVWQKQDDATTRTWSDANTYCTNNTPGLPGTGWRLPTPVEQVGIVSYATYSPVINTTYFPNTQSNTESDYWSSRSFAQSTGNAWLITSKHGFTAYKFKDFSSYVHCVRGQSTISSFTDNSNGTVTDNMTGLMWQQQDDGTAKTWENALSYCENLSLASYNNWRLPNVKELNSLVEYSRYNPAIDPVFSGTQSSSYWSSSTLVNLTANAWILNFDYGDADSSNKAGTSYVRCVRGGQ